MKLSLASIAFALGMVAHALASPAPQTTTTIFHCGGESGAVCPSGWRCCGPLSVENGGTCHEGLTGVCPL